MKKYVMTSVLYTAITAVLLGLVYPLAMTGLARVLFPKQAGGSLIVRDGGVVGVAADWAGVYRGGVVSWAALGCGRGV